MTAVVSRDDGSAGQPDGGTPVPRYVLDDLTKQLLRQLMGDGYPEGGPETGRPVDWEAIWSLAEREPSEELALGSAVLAAREALERDPLPAPSALLVRSRPNRGGGDQPAEPATPASSQLGRSRPSTPTTPGLDLVARAPSRPVTARARTAPELPRRLRRAVASATWVRNVGIIIVLFAAWQLWGTGIAEAHSQSRLGAQYELLVQAAARDAATSTNSSTTATSAPVATNAGPVPAREGKASVHAKAALRSKASVRFVAGVHSSAALTTEATRQANSSFQAETKAFSEETLPGGVLGRIRIPAIGVSDYFVEGVGEGQLQEGPGRYPGTGLPGQAGNLAIAGHRTTYGAPFFRLSEVRVGDLVIIDAPEGRATYRVSQPPFAVSPYDVDVLSDFGDARLTLTTCNPPFLATTRLIVVAKLAQWLPTGPRSVPCRRRGPAGGATPRPLRHRARPPPPRSP